MPWDAIAWTLDLDITGQTLQDTIGLAMDYSKCLSALKQWLLEPVKKKRKKWAGDIYAKYPPLED